MRLVADLAGVDRASLTLADEAGLFAATHEDIPLEPAHGSVRVAYSAEMVRSLPDSVVHIRLATESAGQPQRVTEYTLHHSHAGPPGVDA
jgi:hypothetical protein